MKLDFRIKTSEHIIVYLIVVSINFLLAACQKEWERPNTDLATMDDIISRTDYLITIYSHTSRKPCLYFAEDRFSQLESNLINCTWYKNNACCKRTEVASVFLSMFTLYRASQQCMNLMNYMMCYFCSPDQYIWYRGTQVSICLKFCDEVFEECRSAEYGGRTLGSTYKNGTAFCEAQDFQVIKVNQQCFDFDPTPFSAAYKFSSGIASTHLFLVYCLFFNFLFIFK